MSKSRWLIAVVSIFMIAVFVLSACQPAADGKTAEEAATEAAATEALGKPVTGGTLVVSTIEEPDTLDIYKSAFAVTNMVTADIGAALVAKNAEGQIVPYLAESWDISEDGLVYTFHLRKDVKFHNGEPFTAKDYEWTWNRCLAENFVCPVSSSMLAVFTNIEAKDDYTLELTLAEPNYYTLSNLSANSYLQPLNQKAVEAAGENYGMGATAIGVGPYMVKEWIQDEKIILTRNPEYTWGPEYSEGCNTGPYYIENYEYRILPDLATQLAGLEANEINFSGIEPKDLQSIKDTGNFQIFEMDPPGYSFFSFNMRNEKFSDVKVRQALNMAIDKELVVQVVLNDQGSVLDGPLAPAMIGYDADTMKGSGPAFDLEEAKTLMQEAGYTYGSDGMLVGSDGSPVAFTLTTMPDEQSTKIATMVVDMWKKLGVGVTIEQLEVGIMVPKLFAGEYEICAMTIGWPDADLMYMMFHSSKIGSVNFAFTEDPELDALLQKAHTVIEPAAHQEAVNAAYTMIQDKAYMIPLYITKAFYAVGNDFHGVKSWPFIGVIFSDVYYAGE